MDSEARMEYAIICGLRRTGQVSQTRQTWNTYWLTSSTDLRESKLMIFLNDNKARITITGNYLKHVNAINESL